MSRGIIRRAGVLATLGVCGSALVGAPGALSATVRSDTSSQTIVYYGPKDPRTTNELIHRLDVSAGPTDARYWLAVSQDWGNTESEGQFERGQASKGPVLEGPGHLGPPRGGFAISATRTDSDLYTGRDRCPAPISASSTTYYELTVPARSTTTVVMKRRLALTHAPTRAPLYVQKWKLAPAVSDDPNADLKDRDPIFGPLPELAGLEPARLSLYVGITGSGRAITAGQKLAAGAGQALTLSGQLTPARRGERITIWHYSPGEAAARPLATVRVDRRGRFLHRHWRPTATGLHELYASYAGRTNAAEATRSACGGPKITVGASARSKRARGVR